MEGLRNITESSGWDNRYPSRVSNRAPFEYGQERVRSVGRENVVGINLA
jgi:hypothetical protein